MVPTYAEFKAFQYNEYEIKAHEFVDYVRRNYPVGITYSYMTFLFEDVENVVFYNLPDRIQNYILDNLEDLID